MPVIGQYNYSTMGLHNKTVTSSDHANDLICSQWEEAIIKAQRMPDTPFDLMQQETINQIHNNNQNHMKYKPPLVSRDHNKKIH
ncbi:unnamed protein product [Adineta steineri]|uniref:Uncharacterized protein n=1 Tax=Adineta steineri TaxID=433720 RepID=A0A819KTL7_9BILA|nr:unnamed protein product [Adineta steineri]CAF3950310.1 unnamed protein product [Adineta steineri]